MSASDQARLDYDAHAGVYNDYSFLPSGKLEKQLIEIALGDCTGLTILDIGGGNGIHARQAINLGASLVDVVDISPQMLEQGRRLEQERGQKVSIQYHEGDASQGLSHLPLRQPEYDIVMANWIFSFVDSSAMLESIFQNIVQHLKPGGKFVGIRDADPWSPALQTGKYGASCTWIKPMSGGVKYMCILHTEPPVEFECSALETIYSGSSESYERAGLQQVQTIPLRKAPVIQEDEDFWADFLDRPTFAVVTAVRAKALQEMSKE